MTRITTSHDVMIMTEAIRQLDRIRPMGETCNYLDYEMLI